jgi:hypothetical protein
MMARHLRRSSTAAAPLRCGWSPTSTACLKKGSVSARPRTPTAVAVSSPPGGLSWSRCPRAGPAGSLRWGRCPAACAVLLLPPLRSAAGGRRRALLAPRKGVSPLTTYPDCHCSFIALGRAELGPLPPQSPPSSHRCSSAPLLAVADEHGLLQEGVWRRATQHPKCRRRLFAFGAGPPGCTGAAAPPPSPFFYCCHSAPLRVVADEHCLPQQGVCLRPTTYPTCDKSRSTCCRVQVGCQWMAATSWCRGR